MPKIVNEKTQEELEFEILAILNKIGLEFSVHDAIPIHIHFELIELRKAFVAYVDNTRLLKNQPKETSNLL